MESKYVNYVLKSYFIAVAVLMYYFLNEVIQLGIFITYRHAFALVLFASAFIVFLFKPNIARGTASIKAASSVYSASNWFGKPKDASATKAFITRHTNSMIT